MSEAVVEFALVQPRATWVIVKQNENAFLILQRRKLIRNLTRRNN